MTSYANRVRRKIEPEPDAELAVDNLLKRGSACVRSGERSYNSSRTPVREAAVPLQQGNPTAVFDIDDYQKQFDLLIAIRDKLSTADDAINEIRGREKRVEAAQGGTRAARELKAVLHELWEPRFTGLDDQMLEFPLKLNNRIAALQGYLQGPYALTDQDNQVFAELSKELDNVLARLKQLEGQVAAQ